MPISSIQLLDAITQATPGGLETLAGELKSRAHLPAHLDATLDEAGDQAPKILGAIDQGAAAYAREHGQPPRADVLDAALLQAFSVSTAARQMAMDSATAHQSDPLSLQPNRAVIVLRQAIADAIPFAHYLPTDIRSNEARLAIASLNAGSDFGRYSAGDVMTGGNSGLAYLTSSRVHTLVDTAGTWGGTLTTVQTDADTCDQTADSVKLIRGRTLIYLNGRVIGQEASPTGTGASAVSGAVTISSTTHVMGGTVNPDTGVVAVTFTPALPGGYVPVAEGFVDFERGESLPEVATEVDVFRLFAKPWRATAPRITIDAATQMSNELGLDPLGMISLAIRHQFALERYYDVLAKATRAAADNTESFDFRYAALGSSMARADIWSDVSGIIELVSQQMANDTHDHGVSHLFVGARIAGQLRGAGTYFESSGIIARPHVHRVGRLMGQYEVYYSPTIAEAEDGSTGSILCVGRASDVTRSVVVLGDAVAPSVIPLSVNADLRSGVGFYARNFTATNPHEPSARGAAQINVTGLV